MIKIMFLKCLYDIFLYLLNICVSFFLYFEWHIKDIINWLQLKLNETLI